MRHSLGLLLAAALATAGPPRCPAQDFAAAQPAGPGGSACGFLDSGLPPVAPGAALEAGCARWFGLATLESGFAGAAVGFGAVRAAAGMAQMGEPEIGWNAVGIAGGVARAKGGAGLRAVARRDRAVEPGSAAAARLEARAGIEVGWGAWLEAAPRIELWTTVAQAWTRGVAPPLDRPLEIGARYRLVEGRAPDSLTLWLVRTASSGGNPPDHAAGASLGAGPILVWASVRDRPLRASLGAAARAHRVRVAAVVESHPDLGETVRLGVGVSGGAR